MNSQDTNPSLGELDMEAKSGRHQDRRMLSLLIIIGALIWFIFGT